jgi:sialate O-acetylesterase
MMAAFSALIRFPSHTASSMVVQRGVPYELQGYDSPHAVLNATFLGVSYHGTADATGRFSVTLPAQKSTLAPTTIEVESSSGAKAQLVDVLFGDVFVSSGQSNMELPVAWCYDYAKAVAESATYGQTLRIAQVAMLPEYYNVSVAQTNLTMALPWSRAMPSNVAGMSAIAYFTALAMVKRNPSVPIGAIASSWGGTPQEAWMPPEAFTACNWQPHALSEESRREDPGLFSPETHPLVELTSGPPTMHSTLWNSMIAPLLPLRVSGWYWYQGESNTGQPCFSRCFPALISSWRAHWKQSETPFIFFQLAPWPSLNNGGIPAQRAAQVNATLLPNVGMVVAADRGDAAGAFHPIHPPVKEELSHRAFLLTDRLVYKNESSPLQGPQPLRATFEAWDDSWDDFHYGTGRGSYVCKAHTDFLCGGIKVEFDQPLVLDRTLGQTNSWVTRGLAPARAATNDLVVEDSASAHFQRVEITAVHGNELQLNITWVFGADPPSVLRYGWSDYPVMPLYNSFGLPAPPFVMPIMPP